MSSLKTVLVSIIFGLFCLSVIGYSQTRELSFKLGGGVGFPSGDYNIGFGGDFSVIYPIQTQIELIGGLGFFYRPGESSEYSFSGYESNVDLSSTRIILSGDGRYKFKGKTAFFCQGGLGIYFDKEKVEGEYEIVLLGRQTFSISDSKTNIGLRLGGGIVFTNMEIMGIIHIVENTMLTVTTSFRF